MNKPTVPNPRVVLDVYFRVGEVCNYWLKESQYEQERAIEDGLLDSHGKLTQEGFDAIMSAQKKGKDREELMRSLPSRGSCLKGKLKVRGGIGFNTPSSSRSGMGVSARLRTHKQSKSVFVKEINTIFSKTTDVKFVHFGDTADGHQLKVKIPNGKGGTNSLTLSGAVSDIRRELNALIIEVEEAAKNRK